MLIQLDVVFIVHNGLPWISCGAGDINIFRPLTLGDLKITVGALHPSTLDTSSTSASTSLSRAPNHMNFDQEPKSFTVARSAHDASTSLNASKYALVICIMLY